MHHDNTFRDTHYDNAKLRKSFEATSVFYRSESDLKGVE